MRLGIIARCDNTGLGNQTRELVKMLNPSKVMVIDFSIKKYKTANIDMSQESYQILQKSNGKSDNSDYKPYNDANEP